jgi:hypothetical protein
VREWRLVLALMLLAFALRAWGTTYGFPLPHARPDEDRWVRVALGLLEDPDPRWFQWPTLHAYLLALLYAAWGGVQLLRGEFPTFHAYMNEDQSVYLADLVLIGRLFSSFIGALVVPVIWKLGRRVGSKTAALGAALFMAVSFGPVRDGHWALIEPLLLLGISATLLVLVMAIDRGTTGLFALVGLLAGLTTSAKYSGISLVVPIALGVAFVRAREGRSLVGTLWDRRLLLAAVTTVFGFFAGSPYILVSTRQFIDAMTVREWSYRDASFGTPPGFIHHPIFSLRYSHGFLMELAGLIGIVAFGFRSAGRTVVSVYGIVTYLALGPARIIPMRYGCSVAPTMVLGAAFTLEWIASRRPQWRWLPVALALAFAAEPLYRDIRFDQLLTRVDTRAQAMEWLAAHAPAGTLVAARDSKALRWVRPPLEERYEVVGLPEGDDATARADRDAVLERVAQRQGYVLLQETFTGYASFAPELHDAVRRRAALAATFDPYAPRAQPLYDPHDAFFVPVAGFEGVRRPGPRLTLYRVVR